MHAGAEDINCIINTFLAIVPILYSHFIPSLV